MASDARGLRLKRSIWGGVDERGYVAQQTVFHVDEVIWTAIGMPVDNDLFARKVFLYLFAVDCLGRRIDSDDSGEFVAGTTHRAVEPQEVHRVFQSGSKDIIVRRVHSD